jgi:hypothetical protein
MSPQIPLNLDFVKYLGISYEAAIILKQIHFYYSNNESRQFQKTKKEFSDFLCLPRRKFERALKEIERYIILNSAGKSGSNWGINEKEYNKALKAIENKRKYPPNSSKKKRPDPPPKKEIKDNIRKLNQESFEHSFYLKLNDIELNYPKAVEILNGDQEAAFMAKRISNNSGLKFKDLFQLFLELSPKRVYPNFKEWLNHLKNWTAKGGHKYKQSSPAMIAGAGIQNKRDSLFNLIENSNKQS